MCTIKNRKYELMARKVLAGVVSARMDKHKVCTNLRHYEDYSEVFFLKEDLYKFLSLGIPKLVYGFGGRMELEASYAVVYIRITM